MRRIISVVLAIALMPLSVTAQVSWYRTPPVWAPESWVPDGNSAGTVSCQSPPRPLQTEVVGTLERSRENRYAFGDTDNDGLLEAIILTRTDTTVANYRVFEYRCDGSFSSEFTGEALVPFCAGDFDLDGRHEILGYGAQRLAIYESPSPSVHPSVLSWQSASVSGVIGWARVADTDRDEKLEILYTENFFGGTANLLVFENTADDTWDQRGSFPLSGNASAGNQLVADLDGDGYLEIVVSGVRGRIYIFESRANDSWEQSWSDSTGMRNAYAVAGGVDTDGNGVPEFFVQGNTATSPVLLRSLVFEAAGNDSFDTVATLDVPTSGVGLPHNAVGNVDMDANLEYIMLTFGGTARVYEAASIGTWCLTDSITTTGGLGAVYIEEFNQIPPNDLFYHTSPDAVVVQSSGGDSGIRETGVRRSRLFVQPNPAHGVVSLCAHDLRPLSATLSVYDVRGRLVSQGIVHPTDVCDFEWNASNAPAGVYVLELAQRGKRYVGHTVVLPTP